MSAAHISFYCSCFPPDSRPPDSLSEITEKQQTLREPSPNESRLAAAPQQVSRTAGSAVCFVSFENLNPGRALFQLTGTKQLPELEPSMS